MQELTHTLIKEKILPVLNGGEILLTIPPFGSINDIALGPHILRTLAVEKGYKTDILYLNLLLASRIGVELYEEIYNSPEFWMLGERLFARSAYGLPPLGKNPECCADEAMSICGKKKHVKMFYERNHQFDPNKYLQTEQICKSFIDEVIPIITSSDYRIVGCTTSTVGSTNCSIALLSGIKKHSPGTVTIIGGSNCEGQKAEGIASLSEAVDYIFSGESETTFLDFLKKYSALELPCQHIIRGEPLGDLDGFPIPDYKTYLNQAAYFLGESYLKNVKTWYESSRGCWWAQKSKCTFCGLPRRAFVHKSFNKVFSDLKRFKELHPDRMLFMADVIMPSSYQEKLLPLISEKEECPSLAYLLKANLDLKDLVNLKKAKINCLLPGIESLSTNLLKLMNKGIRLKENLLLLRNALSLGIYCYWTMLWGFPHDEISDYEEILRILPLIRHLQPPAEFLPVLIMRFSPYFNDRQYYRIDKIQPWRVFSMIYPDWADIEKLALYYAGEFPSGSYDNPKIIREIANEVSSWRNKWRDSRLFMNYFLDTYVIYDNRDLHKKEKSHVLNYPQAKELMTCSLYRESEIQKWAVEEKLGVVVDSHYVPLVTSSLGLLLEFEEKC